MKLQGVILAGLIFNMAFLGYVYFCMPTHAQMEAIANNAIYQREAAFVQKYTPGLNRMQKDFGMDETRPQTLDDLISDYTKFIN